MTTATANELHLEALDNDYSRGTGAMYLFIATEFFLFVVLFFTYAYLGYENTRWPTVEAPKLTLAMVMLVLLTISSIVLYLGERQAKKGASGSARMYLTFTILLGVIFVGLQGRETLNHLETLTPASDAYGSIFYTITAIHGIHLLLGLGMLTYTLILPGSRQDGNYYYPLHNAGLYWHFVDIVWYVIVGVLYVLPHFTQGGS